MILSRLKTALNGPNWECERLKNCKLRVRRSAPKLLITCYSSALSITTTTTALPHNSLRVTRFNMLGQVVNQQANFLFQKLPATAVVFEAGGVVDDVAIGWKLPVTVSFRPCKKIPFVRDVFFCWLKIDQVQSKCTIRCRESSFMMLPKVRFFELEIWWTFYACQLFWGNFLKGAGPHQMQQEKLDLANLDPLGSWILQLKKKVEGMPPHGCPALPQPLHDIEISPQPSWHATSLHNPFVCPSTHLDWAVDPAWSHVERCSNLNSADLEMKCTYQKSTFPNPDDVM